MLFPGKLIGSLPAGGLASDQMCKVDLVDGSSMLIVSEAAQSLGLKIMDVRTDYKNLSN